MIYETFLLKNHSKQIPTIKTYILDKTDDPKTFHRPFVLIIPGGGYGHFGRHEQENVALKMNSLGFSAGILHYSLKNEQKPMKFPQPILDAGEAVAFIRRNAEKWNLDSDKIILLGFSAGGHLAASLGAFWNSNLISAFSNLSPEEIKPNFLVLSYPVITSDENFCHEGSINALLENITEDEKSKLLELTNSKNLRDAVSIEKHITSDFPPCFVWHTLADEAVPVENTIFLANALRKAKIDFEYHLFSRGKHGLSLSSSQTSNDDGSNIEKECEIWPELMKNWLDF